VSKPSFKIENLVITAMVVLLNIQLRPAVDHRVPKESSLPKRNLINRFSRPDTGGTITIF
jgi:hypothetical protein